jgi:hypothetical protein
MMPNPMVAAYCVLMRIDKYLLPTIASLRKKLNKLFPLSGQLIIAKGWEHAPLWTGGNQSPPC